MIIIIAILVALFFAINIGGSGAAASMGIAYGTGAIKRKHMALYIGAGGIFLGALIGSKAVIMTVGEDIIASHTLSFTLVLIILASACISLFIANITGIPLSTSEVTVGAMVGVGFIYQAIYVNKLLFIITWWIITPFIAFFIVFSAVKWLNFIQKQGKKGAKRPGKTIAILVIFAGFLEAFSAGMNNVANAVGPLVGANILSIKQAMGLGAIFIAIGAIVLGAKVVETNGKKITSLNLQNGAIISFTGAAIAIIASLFGIPIPMTQVTTSGIIGAGVAQNGMQVLHSKIFIKIIVTWVVSPLLAFALSFLLVQIIVEQEIFYMITLSTLPIAFIGGKIVKKSWKQKRMKQRSV